MPSIQLSLFGKTSPPCSSPTIRPMAAFSAAWWDRPDRSGPTISADGGRTRGWLLDRNGLLRGESWTPGSEEFPNAGDGFFSWPSRYPTLRSLLEERPTPRRFYLTGLACRGILRRADKRGKAIHPFLRRALEAMAREP